MSNGERSQGIQQSNRLVVVHTWLRQLWAEHRSVALMLAASALLNLFLGVARQAWYDFSPVILWFSVGILIVNSGLAAFLLHKQPVLAQVIAFTTLVVAVLLVVLVLRTGSLLV